MRFGMAQIVLAPPADMGKSAGESWDAVCAWDEESKQQMERAVNRLFLFIITVLPVTLGAVAWADGGGK